MGNKSISLDSAAYAAQRNASLTERAAQLAAVFTDCDATAEQAEDAASRLRQIAGNIAAFMPTEASGGDEAGDGTAAEALKAAKEALATVHRALADRLAPPEREVNLAINSDWIENELIKHGYRPGAYHMDQVMDALEDLWDFDHLENKAGILIQLAVAQAQSSD